MRGTDAVEQPRRQPRHEHERGRPAVVERAECVMLNKGPHLTEAGRVLDDILRRMQAHQSKKVALLRRRHSWPADDLRRPWP